MVEVIITESMASSQIFLLIAVIPNHGTTIDEHCMNLPLGRRAHKHGVACNATAKQHHLDELRSANLDQLTIDGIPQAFDRFCKSCKSCVIYNSAQQIERVQIPTT